MATTKAKRKSASGTKWTEQDYRDGGWGPQRKLRFRADDDALLVKLEAKTKKGLAETIADLARRASTRQK